MNADITKRKELNSLLSSLSENSEAKWGLMRPQNMVEHLATTLQFSNSKKQMALRFTDLEARLAKRAFIYTDMEMPTGLKTPMLPDTPPPFEFPSLSEAIKELNNQLDDFESFFANNPAATFIHPRFGSLNYKEWIIFHNKHFTHHFKQFGLV